jgi:hypothetical protein
MPSSWEGQQEVVMVDFEFLFWKEWLHQKEPQSILVVASRCRYYQLESTQDYIFSHACAHDKCDIRAEPSCPREKGGALNFYVYGGTHLLLK